MSRELPQLIVDACISMNDLGINQGSSGNISVRCGRQVLITPSGVDYQDLDGDDMVLLPLDYDPSRRVDAAIEADKKDDA